jgi:hypothetical protein
MCNQFDILVTYVVTTKCIAQINILFGGRKYNKACGVISGRYKHTNVRKAGVFRRLGVVRQTS